MTEPLEPNRRAGHVPFMSNAMPQIHYAIGDVHGEADRLGALHTAIFDHHWRTYGRADMTLVHLGDLVDRGADSAGVIARVRALHARADSDPGLTTVTLRGNHEQMMIEALDGGAFRQGVWAQNGGAETVNSYERIPDGQSRMRDDLRWLKGLPARHWNRAAGLIFVHAGISGPDFPDEAEEVYLWTRSANAMDTALWTSPALAGQMVVHGHTPTHDFQPEISPDGRRINLDTGACYGGVLTAAVLAPGEEVHFLSA